LGGGDGFGTGVLEAAMRDETLRAVIVGTIREGGTITRSLLRVSCGKWRIPRI
jgi:hypothetical protein